MLFPWSLARRSTPNPSVSSPRLPAAVGDAGNRDDYHVLAGGLASLLSRCTERSRMREFRATAKAYSALRIQLNLRASTITLPAGVLNDLAHEIAQYADLTTRAAARRCLLDALDRRRSNALPDSRHGTTWLANGA